MYDIGCYQGALPIAEAGAAGARGVGRLRQGRRMPEVDGSFDPAPNNPLEGTQGNVDDRNPGFAKDCRNYGSIVCSIYWVMQDSNHQQ